MLVLFALALACKSSKGNQLEIGNQGRAVATGAASDLRVTEDGSFGAYLLNAEKPRLDGIPPQLMLGELQVVALSQGSPRKVGNGVSNAPGGYLFSPDSRWLLALVGLNPTAQAGTLVVVELGDGAKEPLKLGSGVTYMLPSPDSKRVAFVEEGTLKLADLGSAEARVLAGEVATAQFSADSSLLFFRRKHAAAGGLMVARVEDAQPKKIADQVGDFVISPDSKRVAFGQRSASLQGTYDLYLAATPDFQPTKVASGSSNFAFSPDSAQLVRTEGASLKSGADALNFVGDLYVGSSDGGKGKKVGEGVLEFVIAPDSKAVAMLDRYNFEQQIGKISVADLESGAVKALGTKVRPKTFAWSPDGRFLAFQSIFVSTEFGPSADLMLYERGKEAAIKVETGVWGYGFGPKNDFLLARTRCTRQAGKVAPRSCNLLLRDLTKPDAQNRRLEEAAFSFKVSGDGRRVMVTYAEIGVDTFDVAVHNLDTNQRKTIERHTLLPAYFLNEKGDRVAMVGAGRGRTGVYVVDQVP